MEYAFGGLSACGACFFTNPLDVVKTRMQLQVIIMMAAVTKAAAGITLHLCCFPPAG